MKFGFTAEDFVEKEKKEYVQVLKNGDAKFIVVGMTDGVSKSSGDPMTTFLLSCSQGTSSDNVRLFVTEKSRFNLINLSKAIGSATLKEKITDDKDILEEDVLNWSGDCVIEERNGFMNIKRFKFKASDEDKPSMNDDQIEFNDDIPF